MKHLLPILLVVVGCGGRRHTPIETLPVAPLIRDPGPIVDGAPPPIRSASARPLVDPPPEPRDPVIRHPKLEDAITVLNGELRDAFFDYDRSEPPPESVQALREDAALILRVLKDFPQIAITVEGHCDDRGSAEYNLALGDRRAQRATALLRQFGIPAAKLRPVSYGKEAPQCVESTENCWQKNRRAHLAVRSGADL